jgi:predicted glutamine amidotransferase
VAVDAQRYINGFAVLKRDLALAVDPSLFAGISGTTDTELLLFLALSFGLEEDPPAAVARAVGLVEETARRHDVAFPVQMTVATTDGETTWAFRYSSEGRSRTLYHNTDIATLRHQYPDNPALHTLSDDTRLVVSEPLGSLRGAWREVPESACVVVRGGTEQILAFSPVAPRAVA